MSSFINKYVILDEFLLNLGNLFKEENHQNKTVNYEANNRENKWFC